MAIITPKLSVARVVGEFPKPKEPTAICRFSGLARSYERGESKVGSEIKPWIRFNGVFSAVNIGTGQVYGPSPILFLPDHAANMLAAAIDQGPAVRINLEIIAVPSDTPIGYRYDVSSLPGDKLVESAMAILLPTYLDEKSDKSLLPSEADLA